jgi:hypothetical protein
MKKLTLIVFLFAIKISCFAQINPAAKYASIITATALKKHLTIIASDSFEGRETGTEGQRKAAEYIENHFKSIGLKQANALNGYQQFFPIKQDSIKEVAFLFNNEKANWGTDFISPVNANQINAFNADKIVFAGYGIDDDLYNDYSHLDVKNKVVILYKGEPKKNDKYIVSVNGKSSVWSDGTNGMIKKLETAKQKGAIGALIIDANQSTFTQQSIRRSKKSSVFNPSQDAELERLNLILISHDFAKRIIGLDFENINSIASKNGLLNGIEITLPLDISYKYNKYSNVVNASNVIGIIEGTDKKDEYVFLTAHYDHLGKQNGVIYNGADDDGSGTCAVLQMATAFAKAKQEGKGPRRTVVFMTVSGEEKGLWGSEYYSDNPVFPLEKTSVDLNTDMIGRIDTERKTADSLNYVYVVGHDKISSELPVINEASNNNTTRLILDYKFDDPKDPERIYYRSDHYNFARKGVPVLFFYDGMLKADYHQPTDDVELINWPLYEKRAQMIFYTAWEMANRNEMLKRDKPLPEGKR